MRKRRFIYNNDGTDILANHLHGGRLLVPDDVRDYVDQVAGTQITSFFVCANSALMYYDSRHERAIGCLAEGQVPGAGPDPAETFERYGENIKNLLQHGTDIVELCVDRARERGLEAFVSMRMNDLHFTDPAVYDPLSEGDFWLQHPEYYMGEHPGWHADGALNFAHAEVRRYKLDILRELCERFAPDGIELDFLRFPVYFPYGEGEKHIPVMTDFVRAAREVANEAGSRRGHAIELAVRLPASMDMCCQKGFDPAAWAREGCVDFITVSSFLFNDPALKLAAFREALGRDDVPVYGGIDAVMYQPGETLTHGMYRSAAAHLHREVADGIYLFNFFFYGSQDTVEGRTGLGPARSLLHELGEPEALLGRNKLYAVAETVDEFGYVHRAPLPAKLSGGRKHTFQISLAEDLSRASARRAFLFVRVAGDPEELEVRVNDAAPTLQPDEDCVGAFGRGRNLAQEQRVLSLEVPAEALRDGINTVSVKPLPTKDILILRVELAVGYGETAQCGLF